MSHSSANADPYEEPEWDDFFETIRRLEQYRAKPPQRCGPTPSGDGLQSPQGRGTSSAVTLSDLGLLLDADFVEELLFTEPQSRKVPSTGMIPVEEQVYESWSLDRADETSSASPGTMAMALEPEAAPRSTAALSRVTQPTLAARTEHVESTGIVESSGMVEITELVEVSGLVERDENSVEPPPFLVEPPISISGEQEQGPDSQHSSRNGLLSTVGSLFGRPNRR